MGTRAVDNFREYIRCKTVHPNPDYGNCMKFLVKLADDIGLEHQIIELVPDNPICIMTWKGQDSSLKSILLNSHTDVVPVYPEQWKYDPFSAFMTENGDIYGRGTQDMKCVGIQYLEAIRALKAQNFQPLRTVHLSFVPDEEVGGYKGMVALVASPFLQKLNVAFALDEGIATPTDTYLVFYGERSRFVVHVTATGTAGHGSQFIADTAGQKILKFMNKFEEFREHEIQTLKNDPNLRLGDVTTTNLTMIQGGIQSNVIPSEIKATFDCRVTTSFNHDEFKSMIENWATASGIDKSLIDIEMLGPHAPNTATDDSLPWWKTFKLVCDKLNIKTRLDIFPAATDGRYLRKVGIPVLGFSPMIKTPVLLHEHNEFLNRDTFLNGINIYTELIAALSMVKSS